MKDFYQILGVTPDAEIVVIKAAYRALISIYHPDRNSDPTTHEKSIAINEAYSVLSDPIKKDEYDKSRTSKEHNANFKGFDQKRPFASDPLEKDWSIAVDFYPNLQHEYEYLGKISWKLASAFKHQLLEEKEYQNSYLISKKIINEYLVRYFGKNKDITSYAEELISNNNISAARYLNKIVNIMGHSVDAKQVINSVNQKFPEIKSASRGDDLYRQLVKGFKYFVEHTVMDELVELHGGLVQHSFWTLKINLKIDDKNITFKDREDLRKYLVSYFSKIYT